MVRDDIADAFGINYRINAAFMDVIEKSHFDVTIKPLTCLSIGVLQQLGHCMLVKPLTELLDLRAFDLTLDAGSIFSHCLPDYGIPSTVINREFRSVLGDLAHEWDRIVDGGKHTKSEQLMRVGASNATLMYLGETRWNRLCARAGAEGANPCSADAVPDHRNIALNRLKRKVDENPGDWLSAVQLARKYCDSGLLTRAVECYVEADEINTGDLAFQLEAAQVAYRAGYFGRLIGFVHRAQSLDPSILIPKHYKVVLKRFPYIFDKNGTPTLDGIEELQRACEEAEKEDSSIFPSGTSTST